MSESQKQMPRMKATSKRSPSRIMLVIFLLFSLTVFLYLTRLEAHTSADIFLPLDYHSTVSIDSPENDLTADGLDTFYKEYTNQAGRPYSIRQDLLLSRLAYINVPPAFEGAINGTSVRALCEEIERILRDESVDALRLFGRNRKELLDITSSIFKDELIGGQIICEYIIDASGLAGYVLEKDDVITIALRGTDDALDMLDNALLLPFNLSMQYPAMRKLLMKYQGAKHIWLTGHSKGGHNAIYAASIDSRCRATGFNAPGLGIFLSDAQHDGLDFGVNYVINGDVTGFLLFHLERRVVLESLKPPATNGPFYNNRHRMDNFSAIDDLKIATQIRPISRWSEWITQLLWLLLVFLSGYWIMMLLKRLSTLVLYKHSQRTPNRREQPT